MHILLVDCIVLGPYLSFTSWTASGSDLCMYTAEQLTTWKGPHLKSCHWYIEMDPKATPEHEEETRRLVEPEFVAAPAPTPSSVATVEKSSRGSKPRSKEASKDASGGSKRGKRGASASSRQPAKRGKVSQSDFVEALPPDDVAESDMKSEAKSDAVPSLAPGFANFPAPKDVLVQRALPGSFQTKIFNRSISEFLKDADRSDFDTPVIRVFQALIAILNFKSRMYVLRFVYYLPFIMPQCFVIFHYLFLAPNFWSMCVGP